MTFIYINLINCVRNYWNNWVSVIFNCPNPWLNKFLEIASLYLLSKLAIFSTGNCSALIDFTLSRFNYAHRGFQTKERRMFIHNRGNWHPLAETCRTLTTKIASSAQLLKLRLFWLILSSILIATIALYFSCIIPWKFSESHFKSQSLSTTKKKRIWCQLRVKGSLVTDFLCTF